ncbi:restriction endonuclease subunit S [Rhodococcus sp. ACT016]|uniref:restriction endonuclease subunit S n=1 Tax=Rhodococcus sp. ACT016 TaxID=3134808 RepID=UPI003D2DB9CD
MRTLVLGDALELLVDNRGKNPPFQDSGVPVVSAGLVSDGIVDLREARKVSLDVFRSWMESPMKEGDVILTSEAPLGRVARLRSNDAVVLAQRVFGLRGKPGVLDTGFLYYALQSTQVQADLAGRATGTTVLGIRQTALLAVKVPAPDYSDQCAIAEVLGALDDKIAANHKLVQTSDSLADACFAQLSQSCSGSPSPGQVDGAPETTIGELAAQGALTFSDGYRTKRAELAESGFRIIRVADVIGGQVAAEGSDFVSVDRRSAIGVKTGQRGDILLTTKGTVGRIAVLEDAGEEVVYSPQICFFRVHQNDAIEWVYLRRWLASDQFKRQALYLKSNTDMADYINLADMRSLKLALPDLSRQRELAQVLEPLESLSASTRNESRTLAATRDALLPRLMSGELRVRDAERQVEEVL